MFCANETHVCMCVVFCSVTDNLLPLGAQLGHLLALREERERIWKEVMLFSWKSRSVGASVKKLFEAQTMATVRKDA